MKGTLMTNLTATFNMYQNNHVPLPLGILAVEQRIINTIETISNLKFQVFMLPSRKRELVFARHLYSYLMYNYTSLNLKDIGKKIKPNRPDAHDNVIHSRSVIENIISFPKDDRHLQTIKALEMMDKYRRTRQSTEISNRLIVQQLKKLK
jgi:chromosomal replication initiation ATPase DnaA